MPESARLAINNPRRGTLPAKPLAGGDKPAASQPTDTGAARASAPVRVATAAAAGQAGYTTDDLLLYLTGLDALATPESRIKRIEGSALPRSLREELLQLASTLDTADHAGPADAPAAQNVSGKSGPRAGSYLKSGQRRPAAQGKKL
jgi:hypothetical protein